MSEVAPDRPISAAAVPPAHGPSAGELHFYFTETRKLLETVEDGSERIRVRSKCAVFAQRLLRERARSVAEILFKLEAADWLETEPGAALALIREDLARVAAMQ